MRRIVTIAVSVCSSVRRNLVRVPASLGSVVDEPRSPAVGELPGSRSKADSLGFDPQGARLSASTSSRCVSTCPSTLSSPRPPLATASPKSSGFSAWEMIPGSRLLTDSTDLSAAQNPRAAMATPALARGRHVGSVEAPG